MKMTYEHNEILQIIARDLQAQGYTPPDPVENPNVYRIAYDPSTETIEMTVNQVELGAARATGQFEPSAQKSAYFQVEAVPHIQVIPVSSTADGSSIVNVTIDGVQQGVYASSTLLQMLLTALPAGEVTKTFRHINNYVTAIETAIARLYATGAIQHFVWPPSLQRYGAKGEVAVASVLPLRRQQTTIQPPVVAPPPPVQYQPPAPYQHLQTGEAYVSAVQAPDSLSNDAYGPPARQKPTPQVDPRIVPGPPPPRYAPETPNRVFGRPDDLKNAKLPNGTILVPELGHSIDDPDAPDDGVPLE